MYFDISLAVARIVTLYGCQSLFCAHCSYILLFLSEVVRHLLLGVSFIQYTGLL